MRPAVGDKDTLTGENLSEARTKEARVVSCDRTSLSDARHRAGGGMGLAGQDVLGWFQVLDHDMSLRGERKYGGGEMGTGLLANLLAQSSLPPAKSWGAAR